MRKRNLAVPVLSILLALSVAGNVVLYPRATLPLFEEGDRPLIQRTASRAAAGGGAEHFFPIVFHRPALRCVEFRSRHRLGHYGACYDSRTEEVVEEWSGISDGSLGVRERIEEFLTERVGWP